MYVEEIFVADTAEEAIALARAANPADDGSFTRYIPKERLTHEKRRVAEEVVDGEQLRESPRLGVVLLSGEHSVAQSEMLTRNSLPWPCRTRPVMQAGTTACAVRLCALAMLPPT